MSNDERQRRVRVEVASLLDRRARQSDEAGFAFHAEAYRIAASAVRGEKSCRRCSECVSAEHHWIDNDQAFDPPDPTYACKHCDAVGDECGACDGDGEGINRGTVCPGCRGFGVILRGSGAVPAVAEADDDEGRPYPCGVMVANDARARCSKESDHDGDCDFGPARCATCSSGCHHPLDLDRVVESHDHVCACADCDRLCARAEEGECEDGNHVTWCLFPVGTTARGEHAIREGR